MGCTLRLKGFSSYKEGKKDYSGQTKSMSYKKERNKIISESLCHQ